jgi:hypothetical protein
MNKYPGLAFSRTNRYLVVVWPALALLLAAALWIATVVRADAEHERAEGQARKDASAYAEAYEQYITRSVGQMDQITMQLKFSWEHGRDAGLIDELRRDGMFTDSAFRMVAVVDRSGIVRASTRPLLIGEDLASAPYFIQHRNHISTALRVGAAPPRFGEGGELVLFTRRLDTIDDEFDGIVLMAVDARYFTSFISPATLGAGGVVALAGLEGRLRVEQRSDGSAYLDGGGAVLPLRGGLWASERGVRKVEGEYGFADGQARVLGWRHSSVYPLVALVGLSHATALATAEVYWQESRDRAIVASIGLLILGALGAVMARRSLQREREKQEVQRAYRTATESGNDGFYMAALIEVEITESAMMGDHDDILAELAALRALGVKLHVDDFGTGYSSLSQLQRLKMDVLKVDRAFTMELGNSKEGKVFFQAIVSMAHALGMSVVAEGVETEEQLAILRKLDCNEVQGYYIARPVPAGEMLEMMRRRYLLAQGPLAAEGVSF